MNEKLEEQLMKKYPKIFIGKDKPITESLIPFGFECGGGWYWLIDHLCKSIQSYCDNRNEGIRIRNKACQEGRLESEKVEDEWQVEATQVKEKFGGLRFYINGADDFVYGMISFAEHLSYQICEECGSTKNIIHTKGWISTICQKCLEKRNKK